MCRSVLSWTALISAHSTSGHGQQALRLHRSMLDDGFQPNSYTYLALLKACGSTANLAEGVRFHTEACKKGYASDLYLASSLVSMYGKCGVAMEAESVFGAMGNRSVVCWNAMLSAYVENGRAEEALRLYRQMQEEEEGRGADGWSFIASMQACGALAGCGGGEDGGGRRRMRAAAMEIGQALHADARRRGYAGLSRVGNTVVSMYGRCKALGEAWNAFSQVRVQSTVSWNAMLSACVECGHGRRALQLLREMVAVQEEGVGADAATILIGCRACKALLEEEEEEKEEEARAEAGEGEGPTMKRRTPVVVVVAEIGRALHKDATRMGHSCNVLVANALLAVYSKCGEIGGAEAVFDSLGSQANAVSWAAIVAMYVRHGLVDKALSMYDDVQMTGRWHHNNNQAVVLDEAMVVSMLGTCASIGALERCRGMHFGVVSGGIEIKPYAGSALVHAYGSCASTADADSAILGLLEPSMAAWNSQMASHALGGNEIASGFFGSALEELISTGLQPSEATLSVLVQACSHLGIVSQALAFWEHWSRVFGPCRSTIVLDLLGRAGDFKRLEDMVCKMPTCSNRRIAWSSLLNACKIHANLDLAVEVFGRASRSSTIDGSPYVLMSDILALR